jgi:peroxiredoxin
MSLIQTNKQAPAFSHSTSGGSVFTLADQTPDKFTIVIVYRGLHCPLCKMFLKEVEAYHQEAISQGYKIVAVSMDPKEKADEFAKEVAASMDEGDKRDVLELPIAYGLTEAEASQWGLYLSNTRDEAPGEPDVFAEPGFFVIRPDNTIFMAQVQSAPFSRPSITQLIGGLNYAHENKYPTRGTHTVEKKA